MKTMEKKTKTKKSNLILSVDEIPSAIPLPMIKTYMPKAQYKRLEKFLYGQTMMLCEKMLCCYKWDLESFFFYENLNVERKKVGKKPIKIYDYPVYD